jgi:hypothetical protein
VIHLTSRLATFSVDRAEFRNSRQFSNGNQSVNPSNALDVIISVFETWIKGLRTCIDSGAESVQ